MKGWIKLHRSILEWEWYEDINARLLLLHLLVSVNYEKKKWRGIYIEPGSMVLSWANLSESCGISIQKCRTAMNKLESSGEITRKTTNKYQVVSLVKWDKLQVSEKENNSKLTINQQSINNQSTTTKEYKEYKNEEELEREEFSALEFLIKNKMVSYQQFEMQNKKLVDDWDRMIENFNDQANIEILSGKIEKSPDQIFSRLRIYCRNWVNNQLEKLRQKESSKLEALKAHKNQKTVF